MKYLIESPHTEEECLKALDEQLAMGSDVLSKFYFGCKTGDHTGYAIVDAKDKQEAFKLIPGFLAEKACIGEVDQYTPEMIRSFHTKAA